MQSDLEKLRIDKNHKTHPTSGSGKGWVVLLLLLIGGGTGLFMWKGSAAATPVKTTRVVVPEGSAGSSDMVALNATGYVIAAHKIELASKVVGRVAWVGVEMGDKVSKGQVLVRLEDDEYKARVAQEQGMLDNANARLAELEAGSRPEEIAEAKANWDEALADVANAESNLSRLRGLESNRNVSKQELDDAETRLRARVAVAEGRKQRYEMMRIGPRKEVIDAQRATVRQQQGSLMNATLDMENTIIKSPIDGTILERNVEVGEFVTTGFVGDRGAKGYVVSLADLNDLRVELDVSQDNFAKVYDKQPCWITTDAYRDRRYEGIVDLISPEANRQKATVLVRVKVMNPDGLLKPDMNATVSFLARREGTTQPGVAALLRIPSSAVRDGAVFVVENGKAVRRAITPGATSAEGQIEIRKGLIGGEDLILGPPQTLKDGDAVEMQNSPT